LSLGWGAVALTEHGWMGSAPWLYTAAKKAGIKPIIGCELYVTPDDYLIDGDKTVLTGAPASHGAGIVFEGYQSTSSLGERIDAEAAYYNGPRLSLDRMAEIAPHPAPQCRLERAAWVASFVSASARERNG
jgi:DNA polymerase-3 subunit alpha